MTSSEHITTIEQLDALPPGTLIRDRVGDFAKRIADKDRSIWNGDRDVWQVLGADRDRDGDLLLYPSADLELPAQVLWPLPEKSKGIFNPLAIPVPHTLQVLG